MVEPTLHEAHEIGATEDADNAIAQRPRSRFDGGVDNPWQDMLNRQGGEAPTLTLPRKRGREMIDEGLVETQHLRGVWMTLGEFRRALPPERPWVGGDRGFQRLHQIFSRFTRKALNSGV
jgi:hypothetical protein